MMYTDFIAAIDLGTAHLTGMVGKKNASGMLTVIVAEAIESDGCIRRGCVYNVEETAAKVERLIQQLERKLNGAKIGKVYVGIGGQSLRSVNHTISRNLGEDGVVTKEIIDSLQEECSRYRPELVDVLAAVSSVYYLDGKLEANPAGIPCQKIDACYKLIVGRPSLKRYATLSVSDKAKLEIADICVSPLALSNVVLSKDEKELGCALIDFGAGVTNLTVYKGGKLKDLSVIPFGGNTITKDITSLNVVEAEAERLKTEYGSAIADWEDDTTVSVSPIDGISHPDIRLSELNHIIESRVKEILENVVARLEATGLQHELGAGIIIAGGGVDLKGLRKLIKERLKTEARYAILRKGLIEGDQLRDDVSGYFVAAGLLLQGTQNCAIAVQAPAPKPLFDDEPVASPLSAQPVVKEDKAGKKPEKVKEKPVRSYSLFDKVKKGFDSMGKGLFDDEEN